LILFSNRYTIRQLLLSSFRCRHMPDSPIEQVELPPTHCASRQPIHRLFITLLPFHGTSAKAETPAKQKIPTHLIDMRDGRETAKPVETKSPNPPLPKRGTFGIRLKRSDN
jgi:hypothetical protein